MKILQVMAGAPVGGAETAFVDMCIAMREAGQDIIVATRTNDLRVGRLREAGIMVYTLPFGGFIDVYTSFALKRIIKTEKPKIVLTWMSRAAQKIPARPRNADYLVVSRLGGYYKIKNFPHSDYFVTITPDIASYLVREGVEDAKVRVICNFAETEEITAHIDRAAEGVPKDATLILGLGRLHPSKAFDVLIQAVAGIEGAYLWIAGEGDERSALQGLIERLGVSDRVKLLGWRSDRAALFEIADICVFSSRYEPFGTVFVQAWANRTPLVSTLSDGPRQFVRGEEDGLLVPIDDVEAMRGAILRIMASSELAEKLIESGHKRYISEFTKENSIKTYLNYFREIVMREKI